MNFTTLPQPVGVRWFLLATVLTVILTFVGITTAAETSSAQAGTGVDSRSSNGLQQHKKIMRDFIKDCRKRSVETLPHNYHVPGICKEFVCSIDFVGDKQRSDVTSQGCKQYVASGKCKIKPGDDGQPYPECCSKLVCP